MNFRQPLIFSLEVADRTYSKVLRAVDGMGDGDGEREGSDA
jgi:hypothetical protein